MVLDAPFGARGLTGLRPEGCGRLSAAGCVRIRSGGDSPDGLRVVDCRSAAMLIKSALRDLLFCVIGHDKHYGNQPPPVAPPPLVPYGTTFPPLSGGTIKF